MCAGCRIIGFGRSPARPLALNRATNNLAELKEQAAEQSDVPVLRAAGLIVALSAPLGCAAYMSAVDVDHVNGSAKRRVLI